MGAFQFVVIAALRAAQLVRGCTPRIDGIHKASITAQFEVALGKVTQICSVPTVTGNLGVEPLENAGIVSLEPEAEHVEAKW
jgi:hypothetical protein